MSITTVLKCIQLLAAALTLVSSFSAAAASTATTTTSISVSGFNVAKYRSSDSYSVADNHPTTISMGDHQTNRSSNLSTDAMTTSFPTTIEGGNSSDALNATETEPYTPSPDIMTSSWAQIFFGVLYAIIFVVGIVGNVLVCYVVFRNKAMQTVTNYFITNLALSDILLCILAVPFTPLYTFLGQWVFSTPLCHIVPYAQGCSVYISTLTLTAVAIDRFFVIVYPFQPRMKLSVCIGIIVGIWCFALLVTLPYGLYMKIQEDDGKDYCEENWPDKTSFKIIFSICTTMLQFAIPFLVITFCYVCVSVKLNDRARSKPGSKTSKREEADRDRKKRTNRMLIAMVAVFGISWMPLNVYNILADLRVESSTYSMLIFFLTHAVAMSSTCYNPFLYAWLNENFRKEFIQILPCLSRALSPLNGASSTMPNTGSTRANHHNRSLRRCLGPTSTYDPERLADHHHGKKQPKGQAVGNSSFNGGSTAEGEQMLISRCGSGKNNNNTSGSLHNNNNNSNCDNGNKSFCQRQESVLGGLCSKVTGNVLAKRPARDHQQTDCLSTAHIPLVDPVSSGTSSSCVTSTSAVSTSPAMKAATVCQLSPQHTTVDTTVIATHSGGSAAAAGSFLDSRFDEVPARTTVSSVDGAAEILPLV